MQISPINTTNNNTNFRGITKKLSHHVFIDGKKDICTMLNEKKIINTYVGRLPHIIFNHLPKTGQKEAILDIYKTFSEVANAIRDFKPSIQNPSSEYKNKRPDSIVEQMKNMFVKYGILKENDYFDIKFLGAGEYKKAFKLDGIKDSQGGNELCFKVFHLVDKTPEWHKYKSHGVYSELNQAATWQRQNGLETQHTKFYFGDINSGFALEEFLDKNTQKPEKFIKEYDLGKKSTDVFKGGNGHNHMYDHDIEFGGGRVVNRVKNESKIARYVLKRIKQTPIELRDVEWNKILKEDKYLDKRQREAGLAISIKHMPNPVKYIDICLGLNNSFVDVGLSYVLKYLDKPLSEKYFELLMRRKDPITQTVLMNEIPLISQVLRNNARFDDLDIPKGKIDLKCLEKFYKIAEKYVLPEVEEHLASYMHLLPQECIMSEADKLIAKHDYNINDRLLHKIIFVKEEDYSFSDKMEILNKLEKNETNEFLKSKIKMVKIQIIRATLES